MVREVLEHQEAGVLTALIRMKIQRYFSCSLHCIFERFEDKLFRMIVGEGIADNLLGIFIEHCCEVEVNSMKNDMRKISSPDTVRNNGAEEFEMIPYTFLMHVRLFLILRFYETLPRFSSCNNTTILHNSSGLVVGPGECPGESSVAIPGMNSVSTLECFYSISISASHEADVGE